MQLHSYAGMQIRGYVARGYTVIGHVAFGVRRLGTWYHSGLSLSHSMLVGIGY